MSHQAFRPTPSNVELNDGGTPILKRHRLRERDVHEVIARSHALLGRKELMPLIFAIIEQCLATSLRPEQVLMSLLRPDATEHTTSEGQHWVQLVDDTAALKRHHQGRPR